MNDYLLTGANGFLGKYILKSMKNAGSAATIGRNSSDTIQTDLKNSFLLENSFKTIVHCAGKAHSVPKTESEKQEFFDVNEQGTQNLLNAIDQSPALPETFIFISTIAVYGLEFGVNIKEDFALQGKDPYAASKINAEKLVENWGRKNKVKTIILRLPLIAGSNPPGNLGNMIKAIKIGKYLRINNGIAQKSIVLAEDVADLIVFGNLKTGIYNLTDGFHPTFFELENLIAKQLNVSAPKNISLFIGKIIGFIGDRIGNRFPVNSSSIRKITSTLTFNDDLARKEMNWNPKKVLDNFKIE